MMLMRGLREAVGRGELALHYQPLVDAQSGRVVSFEALLRWTSSTHGVVPPSRFIPLAEESNTIREIGKWVLGESCRFIRKLAAMGNENIHVSVNVSPRQLAADDFVVLVRDTIEREGINPNQLEIEITENVLIASLEESTYKLSQLRASGVRLALDDFGIGYSSLTYLRSLPVGTLKMDKSFIDRIVSDTGQLKFICSIINMAHILGLTVVAEGVETEEQLEKLVECQCDFIQGYVFSRPVAETEAILFLDR
jgi:EAL domain-containing protein (putative c-di-GMP-specific phosphodiesterase class I)